MGDFSRDTFDTSKHYGGVRLQQNVPLVDADWNEREDIRRYELRHFLRRFAANGVPHGSNAFLIGKAAEPENDFQISAATEGQGVCLVEGRLTMIEKALDYKEQALYENPELAEQWGVPELQALTTPGTDRTDLVYLDAWEREVDSEEDPELIHPDIGIETAVRLRLEWVVRVSEGGEEILPGAGHDHYSIARVRRRANVPQLDQFEDLREERALTRNMYFTDGNVGIGGKPLPGDRFTVHADAHRFSVRETGAAVTDSSGQHAITLQSEAGRHTIAGDAVLQLQQSGGGVGIGLQADEMRAGFDVNGPVHITGDLRLNSGSDTEVQGLLTAKDAVSFAQDWVQSENLDCENPEFTLKPAPADGWVTALLYSDSTDDFGELIAESPIGTVRTRASTIMGEAAVHETQLGDSKEYRGEFGARVSVSAGRILLSDLDQNLFLFEREPGGQWREIQKLRMKGSLGLDFGRYFTLSRDFLVTSQWLNPHFGIVAYFYRSDETTNAWKAGEDINKGYTNFGTAMASYGEYVLIPGQRSRESMFHFTKGAKNFDRIEKPGIDSSLDLAMSADRALVVSDSSVKAYGLLQQESEGQLKASWEPVDDIKPGANVNSVGCGGRFALVGAIEKKTAYVYEQDGSKWNKIGELKESVEGFGASVDINDRFAIVGAADNGVFVYQRNTKGEWKKFYEKIEKVAGFGNDVSLDDSIAAVSYKRSPPSALVLEVITPGENSLRFPVRKGETVSLKLWCVKGSPTARVDFLPLGKS